jgi:hypothetical protein
LQVNAEIFVESFRNSSRSIEHGSLENTEDVGRFSTFYIFFTVLKLMKLVKIISPN